MIDRNLIKEKKNEFIENQLKHYPKANKEVLQFIVDFLYHNTTSLIDGCYITSIFKTGYCYYFAIMLKTAFGRGNICWAAPFGHIVWQDENGICYDIEGVNNSEVEEYIPIEYIGAAINDFKHIRGLTYNITDQEIASIILQYQEDKKRRHAYDLSANG